MRWLALLVGGTLLLGAAAGLQGAVDDPPAPDTAKFLYSWQPGITTYYRTITTNESKSMRDDKATARVSNERTAMMLRMEVYGVRDDGTARIASTVSRVRRETTDGKGTKQVYDSSAGGAENDDPGTKAYRAIVGKTMVMEIAPDGHVLHVAGLDDLADTMAKDTGVARADLLKQFKDLTGGIASQSLPAKPFMSALPRRVGDEWPVETGPIHVADMESSSKGTCKFDGIDTTNGRKIARVSLATTSGIRRAPNSSNGSGTTPSMPGMASTGDSKGFMLFDLNKGRLVRSESRGSHTMSIDPITIGDRTVPGSQIQSTTVMVVELVGPEESIDPEASGATGK